MVQSTGAQFSVPVTCATAEASTTAEAPTPDPGTAPSKPAMKIPDLTHVSARSRAKLLALIERFSSIFPDQLPPGLPPNKVPCRTIPLEPNAKPAYRPSFRLSLAETQECQRQIQQLLQQQLIETSSSPWGAPVLFVQKQDGTLRAVYDYRALNALTVKNRFPLPRIDDILDQFKGAQYITTLDLIQGYNQLQLHPDDMPLSAFTTPVGHFQWRVLPFGLSNAPSVFSRAMMEVLQPFLGKCCLVYLDDIAILGRTEAEHLHNLELVFQRLQQAGLKLKLPKCHFMAREIKFLGHILSPKGVHPDPDKLKAVADWQAPQSKLQVLQFLGLVNYFRRFIPNLSTTAGPLYSLTKKTEPFEWTDPCQVAFDKIKRSLTSPPLLAYPDPALPYTVITDASMIGC